MIKIELTENYAGLNISGDYLDLNELYDSINYLICYDAESAMEELMQNHLYGFLYDVRHAYQGDRDLIVIDNGSREEIREWFNIPEKEVTDNNLYYSFDYPLPDLLLDIVLLKYFKNKLNQKDRNILNPRLTLVNSFYSRVLDTLDGFLTPIKFAKIKNGLLESSISDESFFPQWFEHVSIGYLNSSKEKREKNFMKMADSIYNYSEYEDYDKMKEEVLKYCKENNCLIMNVKTGETLKEIKW